MGAEAPTVSFLRALPHRIAKALSPVLRTSRFQLYRDAALEADAAKPLAMNIGAIRHLSRASCAPILDHVSPGRLPGPSINGRLLCSAI